MPLPGTSFYPNILNRQRSVLLIDDESTARTILEKIIHQISDNLDIVGMDSPIEALEWLESNQPDLIVTDYRMPDMNGVEFIQQVRKKLGWNIPIMMITVSSDQSVRYDALDAGVTAFLTKPLDHIECRISCRNLLMIYELQDQTESLSRQIDAANQQVIAREKETLLKLAKAGEYRDKGTGNHINRMAKISRNIAEELGLDNDACNDIEYAAPMHDIGKIGIPDNILLKPGSLDDDERAIMQDHCAIGYEILSDSHSRYVEMGAIIALCHHERFDGTGYPKGLEGTDIPLAARIVAIADVFDALVSTRPYKEAWPINKAVKYLKEQAGTHFDPLCVDAFCKRIPTIETIMQDHADG